MRFNSLTVTLRGGFHERWQFDDLQHRVSFEAGILEADENWVLIYLGAHLTMIPREHVIIIEIERPPDEPYPTSPVQSLTAHHVG